MALESDKYRMFFSHFDTNRKVFGKSECYKIYATKLNNLQQVVKKLNIIPEFFQVAMKTRRSFL